MSPMLVGLGMKGDGMKGDVPVSRQGVGVVNCSMSCLPALRRCPSQALVRPRRCSLATDDQGFEGEMAVALLTMRWTRICLSPNKALVDASGWAVPCFFRMPGPWHSKRGIQRERHRARGRRGDLAAVSIDERRARIGARSRSGEQCKSGREC